MKPFAEKAQALSVLIIILGFLVALWAYPQMPERMAAHWNAAGEVDGYMSKFWGLFLLPIISFLLLLLFLVIPKIDPLRENFVIDKFRHYFDAFIVILLLFLLYLYVLTLFWNMGFTYNMTLALVPAFGLLFIYIGFLMKHAEQNWFIGIRTPWTLSSKRVWKKTHERGGKLFQFSGIIAFAGLLFGRYAIWFMIAPVLLSAVYLIVYSYFEYANHEA